MRNISKYKGGTQFKAQWLCYVPLDLTFKTSTFCPVSIFQHFVCICEQSLFFSATLPSERVLLLCSINKSLNIQVVLVLCPGCVAEKVGVNHT